MKKNTYTREVKVGIVVVITIFLLYFGLNFLKGIDIFSPVNRYYATYSEIGGLAKSAPVYIKGYKVGQVDAVEYDFTAPQAFTVCLSVSKDIALPEGTVCQLFDDGLMGGKALQLLLAADNGHNYAPDDTLPAQTALGLVDALAGDMLPKLTSAVGHIDSLAQSLNTLVGSSEVQNSVSSLESTMADLAVTSARLKGIMNNQLPTLLTEAKSVISNLDTLSANLNKVDVAHTVNMIDSTMSNLQIFTTQLNNPESTIGLLMHDRELYMNLANTAANADKLLIDLRENPKRYVHFSLFGGKEKSQKKDK